jgi:hypothetical protein
MLNVVAIASAASTAESADITNQRFAQLVASQVASSDTAPLSDRLSSIKGVLSTSLQNELQCATPNLYATCTFQAYQQMYLDPAIALIRTELEVVKTNVSLNADKYRTVLSRLSTEDRTIYDASFRKSSQAPHGDPAAYKTMLESCAVLKSDCTMVSVDNQPTPHLIPLVLMTRERIPDYKSIVAGVVEQAVAALPISSLGPATIFRPGDETKSPYRMVEKALTKGPNREYPDCSQIFDVFGCIIECEDYTAMSAIVDAFADQHKRGVLQISRSKDRWSTPSDGGWRDLMLNIVVKGVVFEVQVVLHAMLVARTAMDAHTAYNQFRSFAEVFRLLELSTDLASALVDDDGGDGWDGAGRESAAARISELEAANESNVSRLASLESEKEAFIRRLSSTEFEYKPDGGDGWDDAGRKSAAARIFELEAKVATLIAEKAAVEAEKAAVEVEKAAVEAEKATVEVEKAAVEAEKTAIEAAREADKRTYETMAAKMAEDFAAQLLQLKKEDVKPRRRRLPMPPPHAGQLELEHPGTEELLAEQTAAKDAQHSSA